MKIIALGEIDDAHIHAAGGKAHGLDQLIKAGFNVPSGFVLIDIGGEAGIADATEWYLQSGLNNVAVRSSATVEDGGDFSYAGQFKTVLNVAGAEGFRAAVRECLESLDSAASKHYAGDFGNSGAKMSVVVQRMVEPDTAGVCFTDDPAGPGTILVEAVAGLGEALMSGTAAAERYSVPQSLVNGDTSRFLTTYGNNSLLPAEHLLKMCAEVTQMRKALNMPLDTEWAVKDGVIYWLQARPITVLQTAAEDEFDPKIDFTDNVVTRCNIGEMLPGAVTPLTLSISVYAIDWGMRRMLCIAGANKKMGELADYACAFSASGHLFLNLSAIYPVSKSTLLAGKRDIDISLCGRAIEETGVIRGKKANIFMRLINTFKYLNFLLSRNKARKQLQKLADGFSVGDGASNAVELYCEIDAAKDAADIATYYHYITSAHSGAMSSALCAVLDDTFRNTEKSKAVLAELLEGIDGIESVDILASLRRIARAVLVDQPDAKSYSAEKLGVYLKTAGKDVQAAVREFMARHGHRAIREAELRSKGWQNDEKAFNEYLRTVIAGGPEEPEPSRAPDIKAILKSCGFTGIKAKALVYLAGQSRDGVKNREHSKSRMIRVLDGFKRAYMRLAAMLAAEGKLPDEDLIFFCTHSEISTLLGGNPALVKRAMQRRRLLKAQSELRFKEVYTGKPEPLPAVKPAAAGSELKGAPISRGVATGTARVVRSSEDAAKLQKGEIMVAVYTDIGWSPYYCMIEGLITEVGSALSHGAVVAREYALPLVSNISGATTLIRSGDTVTMDGSTGLIVIQ